MTIRLLHTADWHLGHSFGAFGDAAARRRADQQQAIERIIRLAIDRRVHAVLLPGDLFDSTRPDSAALALAIKALDEWAAAGIPAYAVAGTHDFLGAGALRPVLSHKNLVWFEKAACSEPIRLSTSEGELWLYGLSTAAGQAAILESLRRRTAEGFHVGLLHATVLPREIFDISHKDLPVTPAQLAALHLDYIALGHFHSLQPIVHDGKTIAAYCGTPEALRYGESGPRHALVIELEHGAARLLAEEIHSGVCIETTVDIAGAADDAALTRLLASFASSSVYARLHLQGLLEEPPDLEALLTRAGSHFAHLELIDDTDVSASKQLHELASEPSVRGHAIGLLLRKLADTADPRQQRIFKRALAFVVLEFERHRRGGGK